ncbi:dehydrogenase, partial [Streptomyces mirabilis]
MGQREGAAGLTTHAPQAAQAVTLPASLDEAVAALAAMPAAVPVAGGTDLMAAVNSG